MSGQPGQPRDRGLTHLGLVAEAAGWAQSGAVATVLLFLLVASTSAPDMWGNRSPVGEVENRIFLAALAFGVGSLLLAFAGRGLATGSVLAAKVYVAGGGIAAIAFALIVGKNADAITLASISGVGLSMPALIAVAIWLRPESNDPLFVHRFPAPTDGGLSGLAALMTLAAGIEIVAAAGALWFAVSAQNELWPTVPFLVLAGLLVCRAVLQLMAASGMRQSDTKASRRYTFFGLATAAVFVVVNVALEWDKLLFIFALGWGAVLASWPYVVHSFLSRHARHDAAATSQSTDLGLTAVGWLLLFFGVREAISYGLGLATASIHGVSFTLESVVPALLAFGQVWAGLEILALTRRMRVAVGLYAASGIAAAALMWREIAVADSGGGLDIANSAGLGGVAAAATLALPLVSFVLVIRSR